MDQHTRAENPLRDRAHQGPRAEAEEQQEAKEQRRGNKQHGGTSERQRCVLSFTSLKEQHHNRGTEFADTAQVSEHPKHRACGV